MGGCALFGETAGVPRAAPTLAAVERLTSSTACRAMAAISSALTSGSEPCGFVVSMKSGAMEF